MPKLTWEQIAPEVVAEPMTVTLGPGPDAPVVRFQPFTDLPGDDVDEIVRLIEPYATVDEGDLTDDDKVRFLHVANRLRALALHPDDRETWTQARIGIATQLRIVQAVVGWYAAAGTSGEGHGPATS